MTRPLGNFYLCRKLVAEDRIGEIILPPSAQDEPTDALVVVAGPGRLLDSGQHYPMQAQAGDRLITLPHHFHEERGYRGLEGYIRDEEVVAVIRGPHHTTLEPTGEWVLLEPDRAPTHSEGGILLSGALLRGGESRDGERGEELYTEFMALGTRHYQLHRDEWEMRRLFKREVSSLSPADQQALAVAYEKRGETHWQYHLTRRSLEAPRSGVVRGIGPGFLMNGARFDGLGIYSPEPPPSRLSAGFISTGDRVHWDSADTVELHVGGERRLLVKSDDLMAVEC